MNQWCTHKRVDTTTLSRVPIVHFFTSFTPYFLSLLVSARLAVDVVQFALDTFDKLQCVSILNYSAHCGEPQHAHSGPADNP
jgi:hypothetical protein